MKKEEKSKIEADEGWKRALYGHPSAGASPLRTCPSPLFYTASGQNREKGRGEICLLQN